MDTTKDVSKDLEAIFALLRASYAKRSNTEIMEDIARRLNLLAGRKRNWTWRYIQGIRTGDLGPGENISNAITILRSRLTPEDATANIDKTEVVGIGITPGSWILGKSRVCADPGCLIDFVPVVHNQKYCPLHRRRR